MYCYFLSLDMDGCHISDPHIPMRTLYACVCCVPRDEINPQQRDGPREATFCTLHVNLRRLCPDAHG